MAYEKLFEPIEICGHNIKNRYAAAALNYLNSSLNPYDGTVSEEDIAYHVARAVGGVGMIVAGAMCPTQLGVKMKAHPFIHMNHESQVPALYQLTEAVHLAGAKVVVQVLPSMGGRGTPINGEAPVSPTGGIPYPGSLANMFPVVKDRIEKTLGPWFKKRLLGVPVPREIKYDEIQTLIAETAENCKLAIWAGFDGVEVHACHHYLVDEFRDPMRNKRTDQYGGSEENRNRLIIELVDAVLKSVKPERKDFMIGVRIGPEQPKVLNGVEYNGYTWEETKRLAKQLEDLGLDYFHLTLGIPPVEPAFVPQEKDGQLLHYSQELKSILKIPVITPMVHDPDLALKAVSEGMTDMISLGRPFMADPDFVNKVKENKVKEINECKREGLCWINQSLVLPGRCTVNPELGREKYNPRYQILKGFKGAGMIAPMLRTKQTK